MAWSALVAAANTAYAEENGYLSPLTPLGPMFFIHSKHVILGEKQHAYYDALDATPIYLEQGISVAAEKRLYMRFRISPNQSDISWLHGYYKACGILNQNDRLERLKKLLEGDY
jgi:hypothetical protein